MNCTNADDIFYSLYLLLGNSTVVRAFKRWKNYCHKAYYSNINIRNYEVKFLFSYVFSPVE